MNERAVVRGILKISGCLVLAVSLLTSSHGQGVDNTRMGAYRALAELSFRAFQEGDNATAAELARILERVWDQGEWKNSSDGSFCKANRSLCQPIDQALDVFIGPIMGASQKTPDRKGVEASYNDFLEKLKQAELTNWR